MRKVRGCFVSRLSCWLGMAGLLGGELFEKRKNGGKTKGGGEGSLQSEIKRRKKRTQNPHSGVSSRSELHQKKRLEVSRARKWQSDLSSEACGQRPCWGLGLLSPNSHDFLQTVDKVHVYWGGGRSWQRDLGSLGFEDRRRTMLAWKRGNECRSF